MKKEGNIIETVDDEAGVIRFKIEKITEVETDKGVKTKYDCIPVQDVLQRFMHLSFVTGGSEIILIKDLLGRLPKELHKEFDIKI